eukprot:g8249.t1
MTDSGDKKNEVVGEPIQPGVIAMALPVNAPPQALATVQAEHELPPRFRGREEEWASILENTSNRILWLGVFICGMATLQLMSTQFGGGSSQEKYIRVLLILDTILIVCVGVTAIYTGCKKDLLSAKLFLLSVYAYGLVRLIIFCTQLALYFSERYKQECQAWYRDGKDCTPINFQTICQAMYSEELKAATREPLCVWSNGACQDNTGEICSKFLVRWQVVCFLQAFLIGCYIFMCFRCGKSHDTAVKSHSLYRNERQRRENQETAVEMAVVDQPLN